MRFTIEAAGTEAVRTELRRFGERITDPMPLFDKIALRIEGEIEKQFATSGQNFRQSWPQLSPITVARKRALGYAQPNMPLIATGKLKKSFREGGPNHYRLIDRTEITIGTIDPVAKFHDQGTQHIPQRKIVAWTPEFRREIAKRFQRYIVKGEV